MTFSPWLEPIWQRLDHFVKQNKVPHAILFCGFKGDAQTALLQAFTQLLLCKTPIPEGACGSCRSCYLFQQQNHPDLRCYGEKENINIENSREIHRFLSQTSHQAGKKVLLLWQVENLTAASGNALLKTLEEPPGDCVLILVAKMGNILPTIKSRCVVINFPIPSNDVMMDEMMQSGADLQRALYQALITGNINAFSSEEIQQFFTVAPLATLYSFYSFLVDFIRHALCCSTSILYTNEQLEQLNALLRRINVKELFIYLESIKEAIRALSLPGTNKPLLFEALLSQWYALYCQGKKYEFR